MDPRLTKIPETTVGLAEARAILAKLPEPVEPISVARLREAGHSGAIYVIGIADGSFLVLKLYPTEPAWRMRKEVYVGGLLDRIPGLPTPRILLVDDTCRLLPFRFAIMTRLAGTRLDLCERDMSEQQMFAVWADAAAHLRQIHDTPMSAFGYLIEDRLIHSSGTNRGYMDAMWRAKMRDFRAHEENRALADLIDSKWRSRGDLLDGCRSPQLCHNDFGPGNLLALRENGAWRISGLFDFENAFAGDPLMDIAKCVHFAKVGDQVRWKGIIEGYSPIARPDWRETVALYALYIAVEYWVWLSFLGRPKSELGPLLLDISRAAEEV